MEVNKNVILMRRRFNYSQEEVANKLGVTRQTYIKIENGEKEIDVKQLDILAGLYGVPVQEFYFEVFDYLKFKQMYLYVLSLFGRAGVTKTKLAKILYLIDFKHFYENLEPMSGVSYKCKTYGPLSDTFLELTDEMSDSGEIQIDNLSLGAKMLSIKLTKYKTDFYLLSEDDKKEIEEVYNLWKDVPTNVIVNYTHSQKPWMCCRDGEVIPYTLILQEEPDHVYTPVV